MSPDDVRMTAQLVVGRRVHCVSDEAVEAMARRVLELEGADDVLFHSIELAQRTEREACAKLCDDTWAKESKGAPFRSAMDYSVMIRTRGAK